MYSLIIYLQHNRNTVKYSLTYDGPSFDFNKIEQTLSKKDFKKFERQTNKFDFYKKGCGNFILNNLEQDYKEKLLTE